MTTSADIAEHEKDGKPYGFDVDAELLRSFVMDIARQAWNQGVNEGRAENFLRDDFVPTPNPYGGPDVLQGVEIYAFHLPVPDMPQLFHVKCLDHPDHGFCGTYVEAFHRRADHIAEEHA